MKIEISEQYLMLMASALNDAIRFNEAFLMSETIKDISDHEEHLTCLENFQHWLEDEYKELSKKNSNLIAYDKIVKK